MLYYFTLHITLYDICISRFSFQKLLFTNRLFIGLRTIKILFENYVCMTFLLYTLYTNTFILYLIYNIAYQLIIILISNLMLKIHSTMNHLFTSLYLWVLFTVLISMAYIFLCLSVCICVCMRNLTILLRRA